MEAITTEIRSYFPADVGPQGAEVKAQLKAACERRRDILDRWQAAQRDIEALAIDAGLLRVSDSVIVKQLDDIGKCVQHTVELIRETIRDRYFKTTATETFDEAWSAVSSEGRPVVR